MATGYLLMKVTVPTEQQLYDRLAPDLKRQVDARRAERLSAQRAGAGNTTSDLTNPDPDQPNWSKPPSSRRS